MFREVTLGMEIILTLRALPDGAFSRSGWHFLKQVGKENRKKKDGSHRQSFSTADDDLFSELVWKCMSVRFEYSSHLGPPLSGQYTDLPLYPT